MPRRVTDSQADTDTSVPGLDLSEVGRVVEQIDPHGNLIAVLQHVQAHYGYLPEPVINEIARLSGVPASRIYGIVTFYAQFSTEPSGRHKVFVCHGTACHVAGAPRITEAIEQELGVTDGGTTPDMSFTLDSVACMGACSQAPVMRIDADTFGNLTPDSTRKFMLGVLDELGLSADDLAGGAAAPGAAEANPETPTPEAAAPKASDASAGRQS
jgi:NADH:ubiquinone oxidoreductase subunit E